MLQNCFVFCGLPRDNKSVQHKQMRAGEFDLFFLFFGMFKLFIKCYQASVLHRKNAHITTEIKWNKQNWNEQKLNESRALRLLFYFSSVQVFCHPVRILEIY